MLDSISTLLHEIESFSSSDANDIETFRIRMLGRNGIINELFDRFREVAPEEKKLLGKPLNELKQKAQEKIKLLQEHAASAGDSSAPLIDYTVPGIPSPQGARHPLSLVKNRIIEIFASIGFSVADGPEVEDDWHNFSALNFPEDHPARDMQDTFFVKGNKLALRTHTSSVQIRVMEQHKPPMRILAPGRVYRNEAISARAHCQFHQVEGFYVDKKVSFADLKQTLMYFAENMFGPETKIRLRPSYFPFTEPSAEMDVSCMFCSQKGCNICKHSGWVEILGCGMIDPDVLKNCHINPEEFSGFAFGMGVERIAMLTYGVNDLRLFFENDLRVLKQFTFV
jgi:phenylalanyl-tRNA synthetase alpha chain